MARSDWTPVADKRKELFGSLKPNFFKQIRSCFLPSAFEKLSLRAGKFPPGPPRNIILAFL